MDRRGRGIVFGFCIALLVGASARGDEVSYLALDGDLLDPVGGNDGAVFGGGALNFVEGYDGTEGGAVRFSDGDGTLVRLAHTTGLPLNNHTAFSVAMWVRGPVGQRDKRIFSEGSTTNNTPLFNLGTHNTGANGAFDAYIRPASPARHVYSTTMVFDDTWHHIAWVDTNGQVTLYVDGVADGTDFSYARAALGSNTTTLGGILRSSVCCEFTGDIDDVYLYDHALTQNEVLDLLPFEPFEGCPEEAIRIMKASRFYRQTAKKTSPDCTRSPPKRLMTAETPLSTPFVPKVTMGQC